MPIHKERRNLPYRAEDMFALVAAVDSYPEFLPWCRGARIRERTATEIVADLLIGFRMFRERFTSRVHLDRPNLRIDVAYSEGPFRYLRNHWAFVETGPHSCEVDFYVEFEFRNRLLQKAIEALFSEAVRRMVQAFEDRAAELYGPGRDRAGGPLPAAQTGSTPGG